MTCSIDFLYIKQKYILPLIEDLSPIRAATDLDSRTDQVRFLYPPCGAFSFFLFFTVTSSLELDVLLLDDGRYILLCMGMRRMMNLELGMPFISHSYRWSG